MNISSTMTLPTLPTGGVYRQLVDHTAMTRPNAPGHDLPVVTNTTTQSHYNLTRRPDMDIIEDAGVQAFFFVCYTTIFVLGVFGNVLVCYVVGRNRAMQTVTNFFITNLALSDILLCMLAVPFTPLYSFLGSWIFGHGLCHLVAYAQGTSVYISTLTLTSIAIDRFFVIIYPFHPRMQLSTCVVIISLIWVFSVLVTVPYGLYMNHNYSDGRFYCEETWPSERFRQVYGVLTAMFQFLVPFVIIAFCYVRVSLKLRDRARLKPGCKSSRKEEADRERKRRTNRMLIAMVTIFGVSWMPLNVINLLNDLYIPIGNWRYYNLSFFMVHALAMSSTCYNPFLYAWLNDNFRKEFKQVLPCFDPSGNPTCGAGYHHHAGGGGMGGMEGGRGGLGGDLALPCASRRSISSAVRTMTTTDDWINNKSASHSPPTPTGRTADMCESRDSSPDLDGFPLAAMSLRGRKTDSVEVENVQVEAVCPPCQILEPTASYSAHEGRVHITGCDPEGPSPTSSAHDVSSAASLAASRSQQQSVGKRRGKSRLFGSSARSSGGAPIHRSSAPAATSPVSVSLSPFTSKTSGNGSGATEVESGLLLES